MKLSRIVRESLIFPRIEAASKTDVLRQMSRAFLSEFPQLEAEQLYDQLSKRESLSSTGIGSGVAIPNAKLEGVSGHVAAFGRSPVGVDFDAIDGKPVHLIFLILSPQQSTESHLKVLARISKFLHDTIFREKLYTSDNAKAIYDAILEKDHSDEKI